MHLGSRSLVALAGLVSFAVSCAEKAPARLRLGTTTSTRDSGLLDKLLPVFETETGVDIDVIAVGTGKALKLGEAGDVDLLMVHARAAEDAFMAAGHGVRREDLMYNSFELLGPPADPASIKDRNAVQGLERIATAGAVFISRGDDSGTHKKEMTLWKAAGGLTRWELYLETGQGMGRSLVVADEKLAYILADRGTYLAFRDKIDLVPLAAPSDVMKNPYGVMVVHRAKTSRAVAALAHRLVDYLVSPRGQKIIGSFRVAGEALFHPARSATED